MKHKAPVFTLALLGAIALAALSGGLLPPRGNVAHADHIDAPTNATPDIPSSGNSDRSIPENTPAGVNIGAPVSATDVDKDTLTYTLGGTDAASFDIDPSTGQLITKVDLDMETDPSYSVTVTVDDGTDANNSSDDQNVTIAVTNVDEPPAAPAPPVVTTGAVSGSETTILEVNWYPPENTGPAINGYEVEYKKSIDTTFKSENVSQSGTNTNATISMLEADTSYQVRVRAKNGEADDTENWSLSATGSTNKEGNAAPVFPNTEDGRRSVAENTPPGQIFGASVAATDANSLEPIYSLAGPDAGLFDIGETTGQLMTKADLNHEDEACGYVDASSGTSCTYTVFVVVDDGDGGSDLITVTVNVTDAPEQPSRPAAPTVENVEDDLTTTNTDESTTTLKVSWAAPDTKGPPIANYDIEYREGTSGEFMQPTNGTGVTDTTLTITDLDADTSYQMIVKANTHEVNSLWSTPGTGETKASNNPPTFSADTSRNVVENTAEGTDIGAPITATDPDRGDELTYSLGSGGDNDSFDIDESDGQLIAKAALDYETKDEYTVTVMAVDKKGAPANTTVTINVGDEREPPLAPPEVTVTATVNSETTSLDVTWEAPNNDGRPDITSYEVECRGSGCPMSTSHGPSERDTTITGLNPFTKYEIRVYAVNEEGNGPWASGSEYTNKVGNAMPAFDDNDSTTRDVMENTARGQPVGALVEATDTDRDNLTYRLAGVNADLFSIASGTGQIQTKAALDHEDEACGYDNDNNQVCQYSVEVKVSDGNGGSDTISVSIDVTDVNTEAPSAPSRPTVRAAEPTEDESHLDPTKMLLVTWAEPRNVGPPITDYVVMYKEKEAASDEFKDDNVTFEDDDNTKTSAVVRMLDHNTVYQVRVRAKNGEADATENWSAPGEARTRFANSRPKFNSRNAVELHVGEKTRQNVSIGVPVDASDIDGDTLTYRLEGVHKDDFSIESRSGHIRTRSALNFEERSSYSLTVRVDDGRNTDNSSAAISVTITVRDEDESPSTPARPTVSGIAGSTSDVLVSWQPPTNPGPPIVDYDVQYRTGSEGFKPRDHDGRDTDTIITGLRAGTTYEVQVRASNGEGKSEWSPSGSGSPNPDPANNAPSFSGGPRSFSIAENTDAGRNIGGPVRATDPDRDDLTYTLEGTDAASFYIDPSIGQIQTSAPLNHEESASHSVTVKADDFRGGTDTVAVTITVTDVPGEAPETPDAPTVTPASSTSLAVSWAAPDNPGPPISDYDYRYKEPTAGNWNDVTNTQITGTSATISSLRADTSYEVQVRARNAEGTSEWSVSGTGSTNAPGANNPPVFTEGASATRTVALNAQAGVHVGEPVTATDADQGDTVTYSLEGADAASFAVVPQTGQITTRVALSTPTGHTYTVTVVASDGVDEARTTVTITVGSNNAPEFDTRRTTRSVRENLPVGTNVGSPVTATDTDQGDTLTYALSGIDDVDTADSFDIVPETGQIRTTAVLDYETRSTYTLTVTANDGTVDSEPILVTITVTDVTFGCATRGAVADTSNTGLVRDCEALLEARNKLEDGARILNWSVVRPIAEWDGIRSDSLEGTPARVTRLYLHGMSLSGTIAAELGQVSELKWLYLHRNDLAGVIPGALNRLSKLERLYLYDNELTGISSQLGSGMAQLRRLFAHRNSIAGSIPAGLGSMPRLDWLRLDTNSFTGPIPSELGNLSTLRRLYLHANGSSNGGGLSGGIPSTFGNLSRLEYLLVHRNSLGGTIPGSLDGLTNLKWLGLYDNRFSGSIPSQLGSLSNLERLYLHGNQLTGSIPSQLGNMSALTNLWLRGNQLTGTIPASLNNLTNLERVRISGNQFTGCVPAGLDLQDDPATDVVESDDLDELGLPICQ